MNYVSSYTLYDKYEDTMHDALVYFLHDFMDGGYVSPRAIKLYWGTNWVKEKLVSNIIGKKSSVNTYDTLRKQGITCITNMIEFMNMGYQFPLMVDKQYEVPLTKKVMLTGMFDYIREYSDDKDMQSKRFQALKFDYGGNSTHFVAKHDLSLIANDYAFKVLFDNTNEQTGYIKLTTGTVFYTGHSLQDIELLKNIVLTTIKAIKGEIFIPSLNNKCVKCKYRKICDQHLIC